MMAVDEPNFMVDCYDFDAEIDECMNSLLNIHGDTNSKEVNDNVEWLKQNYKIKFVEWMRSTFDISLFKQPIHILPNDKIASNKISCVQFGNTVGIKHFFEKTILEKYDKMCDQKAFVHWYYAEGMDKFTFPEAREDLGLLRQSYLEITDY